MSGPSESGIFTFQWMQLVLGRIYSITTPGKKKRERKTILKSTTLLALVELLTQERAVVTLGTKRDVNISSPSQRLVYLIERVANYLDVHFIQVLFRYAVLEESS